MEEVSLSKNCFVICFPFFGHFDSKCDDHHRNRRIWDTFWDTETEGGATPRSRKTWVETHRNSADLHWVHVNHLMPDCSPEIHLLAINWSKKKRTIIELNRIFQKTVNICKPQHIKVVGNRICFLFLIAQHGWAPGSTSGWSPRFSPLGCVRSANISSTCPTRGRVPVMFVGS